MTRVAVVTNATSALLIVERLCDIGVDEHDDEVIEGVHRPAQHRRDERVPLIGGETLSCHVSIVAQPAR